MPAAPAKSATADTSLRPRAAGPQGEQAQRGLNAVGLHVWGFGYTVVRSGLAAEPPWGGHHYTVGGHRVAPSFFRASPVGGLRSPGLHRMASSGLD